MSAQLRRRRGLGREINKAGSYEGRDRQSGGARTVRSTKRARIVPSHPTLSIWRRWAPRSVDLAPDTGPLRRPRRV